jgi:hypothetical protein
MGLDQQARFFPTPQAADGKMVKGGKRGPESNPSLGTVANLLQDRLMSDGPPSSEQDLILLRRLSLENAAKQPKRRLNPRFVEWLMGFPIGWTEL